MRGRNWRALGCAAIIGAAIAFPAGMMFAPRDVTQEKAAPPGSGAPRATRPFARDLYSPTFLNDPYVRDQHRRLVEALEAQCRTQGERCAEAKQARRWMDRGEAVN